MEIADELREQALEEVGNNVGHESVFTTPDCRISTFSDTHVAVQVWTIVKKDHYKKRKEAKND